MVKVEFTEAEQAAFVRLLEDYDQKLSNAGCNDFELDTTQENLDMINAAFAFEGYNETFAPNIHKGKFCVEDQSILRYLRWLVEGKPEVQSD